MAEGIDYSRIAHIGSPSVETMRANGVSFVGRYAVGDLSDNSPRGRGISDNEYARMVAGGIDTFLYYEEDEGWMLGGYDAGARAAEKSLINIRRAGMPERSPVHFAHDIEPNPIHFQQVRECIEGAASVIGWQSMGVYGGLGIIAHLAPIYDLMHFYSQTSSWSGWPNPTWHPAATTHQYAYNWWLDGTNCDRVRSTVANFGQASLAGVEQPKPEPAYALPWLPDDWMVWAKDPNAHVVRVSGPRGEKLRYRPLRAKFVLRQSTIPRAEPNLKSAYAGEKLAIGSKVHSLFIVDREDKPGSYWLQRDDGTYLTGAKASPRITIEPW